MGFLLYKTFLMVSGHLFLLHKISTIQCQDTIRCSSTVTDSFYIYIFYTKYWKYVLFFLFGSLRLVLSNFFPMCFLALALETGKQLMQAWCHWNKAEVMNEHLEHLGTSQKILGRHRTSENVWELGTHGNVLKKRCVNRPLLWKHQATWAWLIWVPKTIQVHFIAISNVCLPKGHLLRPYAVFELPKLHPGYHKRPFEENKHQMSTNFTPARSTILKKNKTKQKHHFQSKKSTRLAQHLHQKNPLNKISVWNSFLEHNPS